MAVIFSNGSDLFHLTNGPGHTAKKIRNGLRKSSGLAFPAYSLDINPIKILVPDATAHLQRSCKVLALMVQCVLMAPEDLHNIRQGVLML